MSTEDVPKVISFLKSCYEADNREQQVLNYFDSKIEGRLVSDSAEILNGELPHYPIFGPDHKQFTDILSGYLHEKNLFLGAFFLKGTTISHGRKKKVCAPLLLIPVSLSEDTEYPYLKPDLTGISVNKGFFQSISAVDDDDLESIAEIIGTVGETHIGFDQVAAIEKTLARRYPEVKTEDLLLFPEVLNESQLKAPTKEFEVVSAIGFCVLRKSKNTVSVLKELEALAETSSTELAPSIRQLLGGETFSTSLLNRFNAVPAALNHAQLKALKNADSHPLSTIIGPPGTGKSYTIAAAAISAVYHGESVLITSAKNQAVDVVQQKIEEAFEIPNICIRSGGKGDYKNQLKEHIDNLLSNIGVQFTRKDKVMTKNRAAVDLMYRIEEKEKSYREDALKAQQLGEKLSQPRHPWVMKWKRYRERKRAPERRPFWRTLGELEQLYPQRKKLLKELIQLRYKYLLWETVRDYRNDLRTFSKAIRARTIQTRDERFAQVKFDRLKNAFPVWLVNLSEVGQVLPMTQELFDLVIIDEASQCDMATALPLLQRAKRAVICGDPKQLRHVSFLSARKTKLLAQKLALSEQEVEKFNFRNKSLLDLVLETTDDSESISFLNEHFRSSPKIIDFSNQQFYGGNIHLMTEGTHLVADESVKLHPIEGTRIEGINTAEAEYILDQIKALATSEQELGAEEKSSIGVLSPFRDQVNHLYEVLNQGLAGELIAGHNLRIGTAHSFQGEERDIMFLSFAIDNEAHPTAIRHLNRADVFNVSITRARVLQHVVYSRKDHLFAESSLMRKYLLHVSRKPAQNETPDSLHDAFSRDVFETLISMGVQQVELDHSIAGIRFDLVARHKKSLLGINLIGYPGTYSEVMDLDRIKLFKRAGNRVFPIPYNHWICDQERLLTDLKQVLRL